MGGTSIDLFAGCGGMSLGLERAGFEGVFVSELHADAMATYLSNRTDSVMKERRNHAFDILSITQRAGELEALASRLRREHGEIDLLVGGPPCQGYSGIGHRRSFVLNKEEIPSNHLYRDMAAVVQAVAPRAFVFENVRGLLTARWVPEGERGEIWKDVQAAFRKVSVRVGSRILEYDIRWDLVSSKDYGVPQNRPRVLMVGIRTDLSATAARGRVAGGFLPNPSALPPDPIDLLGDLVDEAWEPGGETRAYLTNPETEAQWDARTRPDGSVAVRGASLTEQQYSKHRPHVQAKFEYMLRHQGRIPVEMQTRKFAQRVIPPRWKDGGPNITATSLPDDYVHFSQPRIPTVREWARIQTFPDWYRFEGKRTTGGRRRAGDPSLGHWTREVPKYTQIGNAVPVALGEAVGLHLSKLLEV